MKHFLHSNPSSRRQPRGFALVITLSLMVLLTVIAVGLMSLSAISLRSASRGDAMAAARSNARLALTIAIGELQQLVGPDQRITAPANIAGTATGDQLGAGAPPLNNASVNNISKGLTALQPGTRYWTGVWKNSNTATPGTEIYTKTPSPTLLQWLVSGNEISATPKNTPASAAFTVAADGSVSDPETSVLLVGPGTVDGNATTAADNYVTAPLVEISTAAPADSEPQGRYAWWIGDEGVKARINMVRTESDNTASASLIAQRRGWETIPAMASYPTPGTPGESSLPKVITSSQASLLNTGATAARQVFHAATSDSRGVISDVLNGGTRIDLTNLLDSGFPASSPIPSIANYPTQSGNIIPRTIAASMRAPRWSALKDFQGLTRLVNGGSLTATAATPETSNTNNLTNPNVVTGVTKASIAPVVTDFRILMGVRFVPSGEGIKTNPCGKIALAISNPYSVPLKWSQDLEFHVKNQTPPGNRPSRPAKSGPTPIPEPPSATARIPASLSNSEPSAAPRPAASATASKWTPLQSAPHSPQWTSAKAGRPPSSASRWASRDHLQARDFSAPSTASTSITATSAPIPEISPSKKPSRSAPRSRSCFIVSPSANPAWIT